MVFITQKCSILIPLDLSKAFDTVDHVILIDCLEHKVDIGNVVLCWLSFCVAHLIFFSSYKRLLSASLPDITVGVPQGSVLGLVFLYIHMQVESQHMSESMSMSFCMSPTYWVTVVTLEKTCVDKRLRVLFSTFVKIDRNKRAASPGDGDR